MFQTTNQIMLIPNVLDSIIIPYKASTNREFEHCPVAHAVGSKNNCWESWDQQILSTWPITKHGMPLREQCTSLRGPCTAAWGSHIKNATNLVCFQTGPEIYHNCFIFPRHCHGKAITQGPQFFRAKRLLGARPFPARSAPPPGGSEWLFAAASLSSRQPRSHQEGKRTMGFTCFTPRKMNRTGKVEACSSHIGDV